MSMRCISLTGTEHYAYGTIPNPPSHKQQNCIDIIWERLRIPFNGNTSREAYEFIGKYYDTALGIKK